MREEFVKADLFLRLLRPIVRNTPRKRSFSKTLLQTERVEIAGFLYRVDGQHFENGAFRKPWRHDKVVTRIDTLKSGWTHYVYYTTDVLCTKHNVCNLILRYPF